MSSVRDRRILKQGSKHHTLKLSNNFIAENFNKFFTAFRASFLSRCQYHRNVITKHKIVTIISVTRRSGISCGSSTRTVLLQSRQFLTEIKPGRQNTITAKPVHEAFPSKEDFWRLSKVKNMIG